MPNLLIAGAAGSAVVAIGSVVTGVLPEFDAAILTWADSWRRPYLDTAFVTMTWLGSLSALAPLVAVITLQVIHRCGWRAASFLPAALLGAAGVSHALKILLERPRPDLYPSIIEMPFDASFPSAHTAQVMAVALALGFLAQAASPRTYLTALVLGLVVTAVAASRIYLQVHFPTDVIGGALVAIAVVFSWRAFPWWRGSSS